MNGRHIAERLVERGLDPPNVEPTAALYDQALAAFRRSTHEEPRCVWWVPGRLEVFGKHTDYAGGRTLVAAMPRGFAVVAAARDDQVVHVADAGNGEDVRLTPSGSAEIYSGWRHYAEVVVARLARNFPGAGGGAEVVFASNLPRASGMSSSSALVVGLATALVRLWKVASHDEWRANIRAPVDVAGYYACIENGLTFGALAGDAGVGTHGGSEDHVAMSCGVAGHLSAYSFVPIRHLADVALPAEWRFVIASSGVRAEKTGSSRDAYNLLSDGTAALLRLWNARESPARSLGDATGSSADAVARLRRAIHRASVPGWSPDALERRLDHFLREDARVGAALEAFARADREGIGHLAAASQQDADALLGNQIPGTIALARAAVDHGAFAACSFGAGFGGSVWALSDRTSAAALADRWHTATFIATPGAPVTEIV